MSKRNRLKNRPQKRAILNGLTAEQIEYLEREMIERSGGMDIHFMYLDEQLFSK